MTQEEIMKEAYSRYPIGTKYKDASYTNSSSILIVEEQSFKYIDENIIWGEKGKGCLLYGKTWAPIITNEYQIY